MISSEHGFAFSTCLRMLRSGSVLVQNIRQSNGADSLSIPNHMWDFNLAAHEEEFREDLKEASGVGKRGKGRGKRARTACNSHIDSISE
jgi:general transcription factor 3C polypeptide 3 (transcription factor C subunit 4)